MGTSNLLCAAIGIGLFVGACTGDTSPDPAADEASAGELRGPRSAAASGARKPAVSTSLGAVDAGVEASSDATVALDDAGPALTSCLTAADCATWSSYCIETPCSCSAVLRGGVGAACQSRTVSCTFDPCRMRTTACVQGECRLVAN